MQILLGASAHVMSAVAIMSAGRFTVGLRISTTQGFVVLFLLAALSSGYPSVFIRSAVFRLQLMGLP